MQLKDTITKRNYRQSSEKNLEGKQIESDEHEQNWIEKFLVTVRCMIRGNISVRTCVLKRDRKIRGAGLCELQHRDAGVSRTHR